MVKLNVENGQIEKHDSLLSVVKAHPEIKEAALIWIVHGNTAECYEEEDDLTINYTVVELDSEYSYIGLAKNLESFADGYDIWDDENLDLKDGILTGQHDQYLFDDGYKDRDYPNSSESVLIRMDSIVMPSGKVIEIR